MPSSPEIPVLNNSMSQEWKRFRSFGNLKIIIYRAPFKLVIVFRVCKTSKEYQAYHSRVVDSARAYNKCNLINAYEYTFTFQFLQKKVNIKQRYFKHDLNY